MSSSMPLKGHTVVDAFSAAALSAAALSAADFSAAAFVDNNKPQPKIVLPASF